MTWFSYVLMANIWMPSRQMSLGDMGTQSSAGRQALDEDPEAAQEDMKHGVCIPSAPGSMRLLLMLTLTGRLWW